MEICSETRRVIRVKASERLTRRIDRLELTLAKMRERRDDRARIIDMEIKIRHAKELREVEMSCGE